MNSVISQLLDMDVTPALKSFIRSELELLMRMESSDGSRWNNLSVARAINESIDIDSRVSDDTIARFRNANHKQQIRKPALMAIAEFLIRSEFLTMRDLETFTHSGYSRAAAAIASMLDHSTDTVLAHSDAHGTWRHYQTYGENRLLTRELTIANPDNSANKTPSLTATERLSVLTTEDLEFILGETNYLSPRHFGRIPELLEDCDCHQDIQTIRHGILILTTRQGLLLLGDETHADPGILPLVDISFDDAGHPVGIKARPMPDTITSGKAGELSAAITAFRHQYSGPATYYPIHRLPDEIPVFLSDDGEMPLESLSFQGPIGRALPIRDQITVEHQKHALDVETVMENARTATDQLAAALSMLRTDLAMNAIHAGADVNALHSSGLPMLHMAALLGATDLVQTMVPQSDLTKRDRFGRLAHACADFGADNADLRNMLLDAQINQFRARGITLKRRKADV